MDKPTLEIDLRPIYSGWNHTLHRFLVESGIFKVSNRSFPVLTSCGRRDRNMSCLRVNGIQIALDTWDTDSPSKEAFYQGAFAPGGLYANSAHLLKIQFRTDNNLWKLYQDTGVKVSGWTMFPCSDFPLQFFRYDPTANHRYLCSVSGAGRPGRHQFDGIEGTFGKVGGIVPNPEYYEAIRQFRWGLCLKGKRGTDGKNRREVEFSSCGIPLALNYRPTYPFRFEPGEHYVYVQNADDILRLRDLDPQPYAEASMQIFHERFSPLGAAKTLLEILGQT